jgi:hypothetical protein
MITLLLTEHLGLALSVSVTLTWRMKGILSLHVVDTMLSDLIINTCLRLHQPEMCMVSLIRTIKAV